MLTRARFRPMAVDLVEREVASTCDCGIQLGEQSGKLKNDRSAGNGKLCAGEHLHSFGTEGIPDAENGIDQPDVGNTHGTVVG